MQAPQYPACDGTPLQAPSVVGLVLTLSSDEVLAASAAAEVGRWPGVELGAREGAWLALACETGDQMGLHRSLEALPGVLHVDVAFVEVCGEPDACGREHGN